MASTQAAEGDLVLGLLLKWAVGILTSGMVSAVLWRRALRAEAALALERLHRRTAEADLVAARDELSARADERRMLGQAKLGEPSASDDGQRLSPSGLLTGSGKVVALRLRLRERRRAR
jgi:hypothetical protein